MKTIQDLLNEIRTAEQRQDRGKLAAIKRGLSDTTQEFAWPYLAPYCDLTNPHDLAIWRTVAGAAATLMPDSLVRKGVGNIGATMRKLVLADAAGKKPEDALASFDARFRRLLTCRTAQELCPRLVTVIRAVAVKKNPMDVEKLHEDLLRWEQEDVRIEWARGYWEVDT